MNKVSIVYFSNTDVTTSLVEAAREILALNNMETFVYQIQGSDIVEGRFTRLEIFEELHGSEAIIFASPTYMGNVSAQFKAFADATSDFWSSQLWSGKLAAGITCGSAPNGDQSCTLQYLFTLSSQHGMLWVGLDVAHNSVNLDYNRLGSQLGIVAHSPDGNVNNADINTTKYLANRIANLISQRKYNNHIKKDSF